MPDYRDVEFTPEEFSHDTVVENVNNFTYEMLVKWEKGRLEHGGKKIADPLEEAMKECIDGANYFMVMYFRLKKMREELLGK